MDELELLAPLAFVIISLVAGALLKITLTKIKLPYTVGLFLFGIIIGVLNTNGFLHSTPVISKSISLVCNIDPDMILNIFLPILIFSGAYELNIHIFKKTLTNSILLAVPGMVIAMFLTAAFMMGVSEVAPAYGGWNWTFALMFGALISATDPVAVVALLGELGVSKRFSTLIDGESMLNDGTGIVLFMLMFAPLTSSVEVADPSPVKSFIVVVFGGVAIGYVMARTFLFYATRRSVKGDSLLQTSVMILLSYITFILAQDIFKLSGVIALVMFALVAAYSGESRLNEKTQHFMKEFWGLLSYIANTLIFIIMGIIIAEKVDFAWSDLAVLFVVYIGMNLVRMAMILLLYPLLKRSGYGISKRESLILTWGALRGALALTLALMVSYTESIPEPVRRQVLLLTAGIVTLTLIINATTIKWMLNKLGLLEHSASRKIASAEVRRKLQDRSAVFVDSLRRGGDFEGADWESLERWKPDGDVGSESHRSCDVLMSLRLQITSAERQVVLDMFNEGVIEISAQRRLISAIDAMVDSDGRTPLDERLKRLGLGGEQSEAARSLISKLNPFHPYHKRIEAKKRYEVAYATLKAQECAQQVVDDFSLKSEGCSADLMQQFKAIEAEISHIKSAAKRYIDGFAAEYKAEYREAMTARAQRMLSAYEMRSVDELISSGALDEEDAAELIEQIKR